MEIQTEIITDKFRKKSYEIEICKVFSFTSFTIQNQKLEYEDLFEIVGKDRYTPSFMLKKDSESFQKFGESVTGQIFYTKAELGILVSKSEIGPVSVLKLDAAMLDISQEKREELKYGGIKIEDIESMTFVPWPNGKEFHDTGETVVPNVIEIPIKDNLKRSYNGFCYHLLYGKVNDGTEMLQFEKEKLIGIILGMENWKIDSGIVEKLGLDIKTIGDNDNIRFHAHTAKERMQELSEKEKENLSYVKDILFLERFKCLVNEVVEANVKAEDGGIFKRVMEDIEPALKNFEPTVLLSVGKRAVYWNFASYVHIVLRHVKQFQVGGFKDKTPFPYKFEDLKILIRKVLGAIDGEIQRHFEENPDKKFTRHGPMSVPFNGDYYTVDIDADGRLAAIYMVGDGGKKSPSNFIVL